MRWLGRHGTAGRSASSRHLPPLPGSSTPRLLMALVVTVAGCAGDGGYESRRSPPMPWETSTSEAAAPQREARRPAASAASAKGAPPTGSLPPTPVASEREARVLVDRLLPANVSDRGAWTGDITRAFVALNMAMTAERLCAAIAVIGQESGFQSDPTVPGLARIVWRQLEQRREKYGIPKAVLDLALLKTSPDGRSYRIRIDALRTEAQMNALYEDLSSEVPGGRTLLADFNPVRTGGPMQVSVAFAEQQVREQPYPYPVGDSVRKEVFTRRGGVYFGIASLLDYPASYGQMIHRFADFNAGRYSSRNAAFQDALARVSGQKLSLDGDLLRYRADGSPAAEASETQRATLSLRSRLKLGEGDILRDLKLEKSLAFEQTPLYLRLYALADSTTGERRPRELIPRIALKSPKITRSLTTEWFAHRVDARFRQCLERGES